MYHLEYIVYIRSGIDHNLIKNIAESIKEMSWQENVVERDRTSVIVARWHNVPTTNQGTMNMSLIYWLV